MAETNKDTKDKGGEGGGKPPEPPKPNERPLESEAERVYKGEIAALKEELTVERAKTKALEELLTEQEKARAANSVKRGTGKIAVAKLLILGDGRRQIPKGGSLKESELAGLTEGVHFEFVDG